MLKKLKKILKKGAMSVEYIVIGVCVIGMAALATTFVSNKMSVAMGQENNSGDTNNGGNTGDNNDNNIISSECNANKEFFDKYKLYPGEYSQSYLSSGIKYENKIEIKLNGDLIISTFKDGNYSHTTKMNFISNEYSQKTATKESVGVLKKFNVNYSNDTLNKEILISYKAGSISFDDMPLVLPKEAFKLGGHEDCTGFRAEQQDYCALNGLKYGEYTVKNYINGSNRNVIVNISENKITYNEENKGYDFTIDLANETIYNSSSSWILRKTEKSESNGQVTSIHFTMMGGGVFWLNFENGECVLAYTTNM